MKKKKTIIAMICTLVLWIAIGVVDYRCVHSFETPNALNPVFQCILIQSPELFKSTLSIVGVQILRRKLPQNRSSFLLILFPAKVHFEMPEDISFQPASVVTQSFSTHPKRLSVPLFR